jgi:hypothetical protein
MSVSSCHSTEYVRSSERLMKLGLPPVFERRGDRHSRSQHVQVGESRFELSQIHNLAELLHMVASQMHVPRLSWSEAASIL